MENKFGVVVVLLRKHRIFLKSSENFQSSEHVKKPSMVIVKKVFNFHLQIKISKKSSEISILASECMENIPLGFQVDVVWYEYCQQPIFPFF